MITRMDLFPILQNEFPLMRLQLLQVNDRKSPYQALRCFSEYTIDTIVKNGPSRHSGRCLDLAERFFSEGDASVRKAVEFVFATGLANCPQPLWQFIVANAPCLSGQMQETGISPTSDAKYKA